MLLGGYLYLSAWGVTIFSRELEKKSRPPLSDQEKSRDPPYRIRKKVVTPLSDQEKSRDPPPIRD